MHELFLSETRQILLTFGQYCSVLTTYLDSQAASYSWTRVLKHHMPPYPISYESLYFVDLIQWFSLRLTLLKVNFVCISCMQVCTMHSEEFYCKMPLCMLGHYCVVIPCLCYCMFIMYDIVVSLGYCVLYYVCCIVCFLIIYVNKRSCVVMLFATLLAVNMCACPK